MDKKEYEEIERKAGREMWRDECPKYKITEYWAAHLRRKTKIV